MNHLHLPFYQKWNESVRVRMVTRKLEIEPNTKYIPQIHKIILEKTTGFQNSQKINVETDFSEFSVNSISPILNQILSELSYNVYIKEHRLRYQEEQRNRHYLAVKKFNNILYLWKRPSVEQFIKDYNTFIWYEIKKSHNFMSPKIEANYRRNYHDGEVSPITSLVFYLYFKTDKVKRFFSKLLVASYRNPYATLQNKII